MASGDGATGPDPLAIVGALAEEHRLRAFAAVVLGAGTESAVATCAGLTPPEARRALSRLASAGLVGTGPGGLAANTALLSDVARRASLARRAAEVAPEELGATPEQARRIRHVLRDGRLTGIPVGARSRHSVLDFLAGRFEPGRHYSEAEVNAELGRFHDDTAALRRYLVDDGFLERAQGEYWRGGGTFQVD
jgi:hypothetical protein